MDRLEAMSLLVEVVEKGSFSAAARSLNMPVATLSRRISDLEEKLGARLLVRTTRKLSLTDTGLGYLEAAKRILDQVEEAERQAAGEFLTPKGELVVTAPILFGRLHVMPVICDFLALYPDINVRLLLSNSNVHLVDEHVDLALRIGKLPDSGLIATRLGTMRTVVCASPSLLAAHAIPTSPKDLERLPCVAFDVPRPYVGWRFNDSGGRPDIDLDIVPRLSVTTAEAATDAAVVGVGVTRLLHYQVAREVEEGALRIVLTDFEPDPTPVHLLHVAHGQMPLKLRRFLDFSVPRLRGALERIAAVA